MDEQDQEGVSQAFIEDFVQRQLPLIIRARDEVRAGKRLSSGEIELLEAQLEQARHFSTVAHVAPEYQSLIARAISAYDEITELALQNERAGGSPGQAPDDA